MTKKIELKPLQILLGIIFTAAGLTYLFWGLDLLPDGFLPIVGYLDDGAVMVALWILFRRAKKKLS